MVCRLFPGGELCGRPPRVKGIFGLGLSCRLQVCVRPVRAAMPLALMDCPPPEAPIWISRLTRTPSQRVCLGSRSDRRSITFFALPFAVALAANADQAACGCGAR